MKKIILMLTFFTVIGTLGFSQKGSYWSVGSETILSFANIDNNSDESGNIIRFAPVLNIQGMYNIDLSEKAGFFTGLAFRNVGYIYDNYSLTENDQLITVKKKFRTYNIGVPVGIKLGNITKAFLFGGYEVELPFHYKEKTFVDEKKEKFTSWFSDRVEMFQHGIVAGIQLPYGTAIKFKYYFSEFHNQGYTESSGNKPYENLESNIFYISLNYSLFKPINSYTGKGSDKKYF
jgi:hypothetical protein